MSSSSDIAAPTGLPIGGPARPLFSFENVPDMWTCGAANINWDYGGAIGQLSLTITNDGVDQPSPPSSSSSSSSSSAPTSTPAPSSSPSPSLASVPSFSPSSSQSSIPPPTTDGANVPGGARPANPPKFRRQNTPTITETITDDLDPGQRNYTWPRVNVPQGWYILSASILETNTSSSPFYVHSGQDTSCVLTASPSSSNGAAATGGAVSGGSSSHAGAIAGGVVGGVVGLALLIGLALFWFCRRKRPAHTRSGNAEAGFGRFAGLAGLSRKSKPSAGAKETAREPRGSLGSIPESEEGPSSLGHEEKHAPGAFERTVPAVVGYGSKRSSVSSTATRSAAPSRTPSQRGPDRARGGHASVGGESSGSGSGSLSRNASQRASYTGAYRGSGSAEGGEMIPLERAATARRMQQRKPVPQYDGAALEDGNGSGSSPESTFERQLPAASATLESLPGLHHQSSFGHMRPMHTIMPDMPPPPRD